jgi:DNA mismatch repair protein MutL
MSIRRLPSGLINRIAAGEVIERPAAVVKEFVENALDAGAKRIDVILGEGGRTRISVADDGNGMSPEDLCLAIERHATSKLPDDDLVHITNLGFRGEALPSIGSVARLTLTSRQEGSDSAWRIKVMGGQVFKPEPAARSKGTTAEALDLFFATPARLKFLRAPRSETQACVEVVRRLGLSRSDIAFTLENDGKRILDFPSIKSSELEAILRRAGVILGQDFSNTARKIEADREGIRLYGYSSGPSYDRANGLAQYFYVNGRPVRDPQLLGAARAAYADLLPRGRFPALVLFLELPSHLVDVNVHPAKTEVRFREPGLIRALIVSSLKQALASADFGGQEATSSAAISNWKERPHLNPFAKAPIQNFAFGSFPPSASVENVPPSNDELSHPLGAARAQLHGNYILAQTEKGIVLVDQHAAHERLVYERIKAARSKGAVPRQILLVPEVVEIDAAAAIALTDQAEALAELGLVVEAFGPGAVLVRETPAPLGEADVQSLIKDLADEIVAAETSEPLLKRLDTVAATIACHGSVRSGRQLNQAEMNALLREMEATPNSERCNHGRPTYIRLELSDLERLFERR